MILTINHKYHGSVVRGDAVVRLANVAVRIKFGDQRQSEVLAGLPEFYVSGSQPGVRQPRSRAEIIADQARHENFRQFQHFLTRGDRHIPRRHITPCNKMADCIAVFA